MSDTALENCTDRPRTRLLARVTHDPDPAGTRSRLGLRWWHEILAAMAFYAVYSTIRNRFGSAAVSPERAFDHARTVIDWERTLRLFIEEDVQAWFVTVGKDGLDYGFTGARTFLQFWNVFYGTFHFAVTAGALVWLFRRFPGDYPTWRNTLAVTTGLALIGFSMFPLMPPRLLTDCGPFGACLDDFSFVDTLADIGGLWSFDSGTMQKVSNQYAAMPSLHFAWSLWSLLALFPRLPGRGARTLVALYPALTVWAIVVTANHYWIDAVGGGVILAVGYLAGSRLARLEISRRRRRTSAPSVETPLIRGYRAPGGKDESPPTSQPVQTSTRPTNSPAPTAHVPRDHHEPR